MDEYLIDGSTLLDIANAIRVKKGTTANIDPAYFASEILSIIGSGVDMQTLTIINSNNTSETATFTMPSRYTFSQFMGSEYDTSGGAIVIEYGSDAIKYNGIYLYLSDMESHVFDDTVARGTLYYEGAESDGGDNGGDSGGAEQTYTLSGTWVLNDEIVKPTVSLTEEVKFTALSSFGDYDVAYSSIKISSNSDGSASIMYSTGSTSVIVASFTANSSTRNNRYDEVTFDGTQTVSKEFYKYYTANAKKQG